MTALKPLDQHDIRAVSDHDEERKLLRRAVLNPVCAHPECDSTEVEGHHVWPRSFISNSSWYVRIPGNEKPILHVTGLCRTHHSDVEDHRAWIKYEDGVFNWHDRYLPTSENDYWTLLGPLAPQPGQVQHVKKSRKKTTVTEDKRKSKFIRFRCPDDSEDGAKIINELIDTGRELWAPELGWSDTVSPYYVIVAAFSLAFQVKS